MDMIGKTNILVLIGKSLYSPAFYGEPARTSVKPAFSYFFKFILIIAVIEAIVLSIWLGPALVKAFSADSIGSIVSYYPADLTITVKDGQASTNVKEPYYIPLPPDASAAGFKNLLVIDTATTSPVNAYRQDSTIFLLTKDYLVSEQSKGQIMVRQVKTLPDGSLNRDMIKSIVDRVGPYLTIVLPLLFLGMLIGIGLVLAASNIAFVLVMSLLTWSVSAVIKSGLTYSQCIALGLYAATGPILIDLILQAVPVRLPLSIEAVVFLGIFFINAKKHYVVVKTA